MIKFDGRKFAQKKEEDLREKIKRLGERERSLKLVDILVGEDKASYLYVTLKKKAAQRVGINFRIIKLEASVGRETLLNLVKKLNKDPAVGGILFQLPLPDQLRKQQFEIINTIDYKKDVDCLTTRRLGCVLAGKAKILPATVKAVGQILRQAGYSKESIKGESVCILGRSSLVGQPLANWLINLGATVMVGHSKTKDLTQLTRQAKIIISATGKTNLIKADMVKRGAVVIDVGSPHGDVDFVPVMSKVSFITPVPGGVGPVTVVSLLENFVMNIACHVPNRKNNLSPLLF